MRLTAVDLNTEQAYHIGMRRRHNLGGHTSGIVKGLALSVSFSGAALHLRPGLAIDGFGRELVVPGAVTVPFAAHPLLEQYDPNASQALDVWLLYDRQPRPAGRNALECEPVQGSRWCESPVLQITQATGDKPDGHGPVTNAEPDHQPWQEPPDEVARRWPVHLGRLQGAAITVRPTPAGLRGEMVNAVSRTARFQLGTDAEDRNLRFAVAIAGEDGAYVNRIWLDRERNVFFRGRTTVEGHLLIERPLGEHAGPAPCDDRQPDMEEVARSSPVPGVFFRDPAPLPEGPLPWVVYQTNLPQEGRPSLYDLRFEIGEPVQDEDPALYRLAIGHRDVEGVFIPCLSADAACTLRLRGQLEVGGKLSEGPLRPDPSDPRFLEEVVSAWAAGAGAAGGATGEGSLQLTVTAPALTIGQAGKYSVRVLNDGEVPLTQVHVQQSKPRAGQAISFSPRLEVAATVEKQIDITPLAGDSTIEVWAIGFTPLLQPVVQHAQVSLILVPDVG
jgi:uncharacterized repeat protein (TIGR01451 family)